MDKPHDHPRWFMALDGDRQQVWFFQPPHVPVGHHTKYRCERCYERFDRHRPKCRRLHRVLARFFATVPQRPNPPFRTENELREAT